MASIESYDAQVESEYLEETKEILDEIEVIMEQYINGLEEGQRRFQHLLVKLTALSMTGRHTSHALLNVTMSRLINYLELIDRPGQGQMQDISTFVDTMRGILDNSIKHDGWDFSEFVRSLPVLRPLDTDDIAHLDIEVMIVETRKTAARIFERELRACGYRVSVISNPLEAIAMAVRTKPDLVLASAELDYISGIDLACALAAMPATKSIPFALLTSYDKSDKKLADLPENAEILNKGSKFSDDLADVLDKFNIT